MLKSILEVTSLHSDEILLVLKSLTDLLILNNKTIEEAIILILDNFIKNLNTSYYTEESVLGKKTHKLFEKFLTLISKLITNKNNIDKVKSLSELAVFLILALNIEGELKLSIQNFLPKNYVEALIKEEFLKNFFKLLLTNKQRENEFHITFDLYLRFLTLKNEFKLVFQVWNFLIDPNASKELITLSQKNYQLLIFLFSKYILENFFIVKYVVQIFDSSFFESILKFSSGKRYKYINVLVEILINKLKNSNEQDINLLQSYSYNLLEIFGNDPSANLSPQSYKNLYIYLFNNLNDSLKNQFIDSFTNGDNSDSEEDYLFRITALKQLIINIQTELTEEMKNKILEFFFVQFYNDDKTTEAQEVVEDRLLLVILACCRSKEINENIKDSALIKKLIKINKFFQNLVTSKKLDVDLEDYKVSLF